MDDLLTGKEVAELLRVSLSTVAALRKEGKLAFIKVGRKVLVKRSAVQAFIDGNETKVN